VPRVLSGELSGLSKTGNRLTSRAPATVGNAGAGHMANGSEYARLLWWVVDSVSGAVTSSNAISWDRLRFLKHRNMVTNDTIVCPDVKGVPAKQQGMTFKQLQSAIGAQGAKTTDSNADLDFQLLGEELLLRPVGFKNKTPCPLGYLTRHNAVAWEIPGVQVPRIGCKNYWVRGKAGGSSEWSDEDGLP